MGTGEGVIVTGASRGIGAAIASSLAGAGFVVGCLSRSGTVPEASGPIDSAGRLIPYPCDITAPANVVEVVRAFATEVSTLIALVNNAGMHRVGPSDQISDADLRAVMDVNFVAPFLLCKEAFPHLVRAGRSIIVNIGSFYDRLGVKQNIAYCASKAALGAMTRCLAVEWARHGVAVLDIAPGYVRTALNETFLASERGEETIRRRIPAGRPGDVAEIALFVRRAVEDRIGFLTGSTIYFDGGQSIAP